MVPFPALLSQLYLTYLCHLLLKSHSAEVYMFPIGHLLQWFPSLTVYENFPKTSDLILPTVTVLSSPHPDNSGCIAWPCSLQTAAVCPSDHSLLSLFWQVLFLVLSQALSSLLCSLCHQFTSFQSNSIQILFPAEDQLSLLMVNTCKDGLMPENNASLHTSS